MAESSRVGEVDHFFRKIRVATVRVQKPFKIGDRLRIKGTHDDMEFRVKSIEVDHKPVERAEPGQVVGVRIPGKAHEGSEVLLSEGKPGLLARLFGR